MDTHKTQVSTFIQLPLLWVSLAFLAGIVCADRIPAAHRLWLPLAGALLALAVTTWRNLRQVPRLALVAALVLTLGALRYQVAQPALTTADLAYYNDANLAVSVHGHLIRPPVYRDGYTELWVQASQLQQADEQLEVSGLVVVRGELGTQWHYGDGLVLAGRLQTPGDTADFSYRQYLARQGVYSVMSFARAEALGSNNANGLLAGFYRLRQAGVETLHRLYPDPVAGLLAGILLGDETGISSGLKQAFNDTATRHIVAISGFNISIIAGLALALFTRGLGRRRGILLAGLCIAAYTVLVGAQASVVRAAIMGLVVLGSQISGRDQHSSNTLAFTAALMAVVNPLVLWDIGFQLSFAATLGLVVYAEPLRAWADPWLARLPDALAQRLTGPLYEYVLLTLAAQVLTLPLLLYHFGRLSLVALPANLLILPLQPAILIIGGVSLLLGSMWLMAGQALALLAWPLATLTIRTVEWLASPAWASYHMGDFGLNWVLAYYVLLVVLSVPLLRQGLRRVQLRPVAWAAACAAAALGAWSLWASAPTGKLAITLLDVRGEAVLIRTPTGRNLLINGGASAVELSDQLGRHLPLLARQLDWLLILGDRQEQMDGLRTGLERLQVSQTAWASQWPSAELQALLEHSGSPTSQLALGQRMDLGDGASLQVVGLGPRGASVLIQWHAFQALLPVGLDVDQMAVLQANPVPGLDLLLLADGGYPPLNTPGWLAAMEADIYWLTNERQPPADELLRSTQGLTVLSTAEHGWLRVETDGATMWLSSAH